MTVKKNRINIVLSDEANDYLDTECERYGMAKGAYISYMLIQKKEQLQLMKSVQELKNELDKVEGQMIVKV